MSEQAKRAQELVRRIRASITDRPTYTEQQIDNELKVLAEAELTERLARSAAWRA